ncbi:2-succinyl-5-enolpyruvyl-6-hydroxy-3-cyclohexene-1-carboxylate synthase [Fodinibius salinus]|uniref:2-succinyl-5-enolpyruvyl-6-hydroxy-3-cyclohexene-1-carboxylate synthase n=1 Tax=Fodinibius salinus TaxID=860790 RepID=A0A5D3YPN7_9BACT|nr:2-succinyl-5-enolpyruvyl-6-hydroxy-3-cyclohexene-1-carboxylic-acid synthase [Fodinibius salinus]TYP95003.1 2-succinyl-5-enolpyruvyl-6-hydroxy-3-cyclohexene-1-carboxylate synthase [Fodinibius salinus]
MTDLKPGNNSFYWSTVFFRQLQSFGVQNVIISPGSRSTPLTLAAAANNYLKKHVILDERSAAFTALGIGKATNIPAVLVCTSGTAVANYYPAVIEAKQSGIPMIVATADRPEELVAKGANQAINQQHIYGNYPVFYKDIGEPANGSIGTLKELTKQAFQASRQNQGTAHLNFPFRKPLQPDPDFLQKITSENRKLTPQSSVSNSSKEINIDLTDSLSQNIIQTAERPLIIVGQLSASSSSEPIFALAEKLQAPVISEYGHPESDCDIQGFDGFLRSSENIEELKPDLILRFGLQPASKSVLQAVRQWHANHHIYFADTDRNIDIFNTTTKRIQWDGKTFDTSNTSQKPDQWLEKWKQAEQSFFEQAQSMADDIEPLTDGHIYQQILPDIPDEHTIAISNSFPARDQSLFARFGRQSIVTNRGVSGIDGVTSTAIGATIGSQKPLVLFTGDLAFLHDSNALLNHQLVDQPLVIIVINNSGGSIFRMLPIADQEEYFEPYFETPQAADISSLTTSHNIPYQKIDSRSKLLNFDVSDWIAQHPGCSVVECTTNTDASMKLRNRLWNIRI